ncbi:MAG: non-ribosomal peptide synthetase, partial [Desulfobacterales bacterium]|nr:non-ribosomal peptide synthetase [Desulfobacterales bacterium]
EDTFIQFAPIAFDASTFEIWGSLLNGARLIIMTSDKDSLLELGNVINRHKVSILWLTSSLFNLIVDESIEIILPIKQLLAGGEELSVSHIQRALKYLPECRIINGYGPTENTTFTCCYPIERTIYERSIPIGKPINGTIVYILDNHLNQVPIGIPGEIYVGGAGLAKGYLNRPDLTKERFIETSFGRLYKTGDLAKFLSDGNIEYIGRIDNQVKLRGFRIELGEIESVLCRHPYVRESVVILSNDNENKKLIAYITTRSEHPNDLKTYLKKYLPDYMVPSSIVVINEMPLTPNGKIDRKKLSIYDNIKVDNKIPPRNEIEMKMLHIWESVLASKTIGIFDNFFDLGGHSLLAVRLMANIYKEFNSNIPIAELFLNPTIAQLSELLLKSGYKESKEWSSLVKMRASGSGRPVFWIGGIGGNVLYFYSLLRNLNTNRPFYGLQSKGLDGKTKPLYSIEDIAKDYIEVIKTVSPKGPYWLGGHSFGGLVAFEMSQQLQKNGEETALLMIIDAIAPSSDINPKKEEKDDSAWLIEIADMISISENKKLNISYNDLLSLSPEEQLDYFNKRLIESGISFPYSNPKQVRGLLEVYKANAIALNNYQKPKDVYPVQIALFKAKESIAAKLNSDDETLGWQIYSKGKVNTHIIPGDHNTMMNEPNVSVLAKYISQYSLLLE